jgi:hypothetical protein
MRTADLILPHVAQLAVLPAVTVVALLGALLPAGSRVELVYKLFFGKRANGSLSNCQ